jgi:hypothetical protein
LCRFVRCSGKRRCTSVVTIAPEVDWRARMAETSHELRQLC